MSFRFHLAGVLRLRESIERAEQLALNLIIQQMVPVERDLRHLEEIQDRVRERLQSSLARGLSAAEVREVSERESQLRQSAETLRSRLLALEVRRIAQLEIYKKARQEVEILSEIRAQNFRSYRRTQRRQEQKELDDLFLARRKAPN